MLRQYDARALVHELTPTFDGVSVRELPTGYIYRATRFADLILRDGFPEHFQDLCETLDQFYVGLDELRSGGGNRSTIAARLDGALYDRGWGKQNVEIETRINGQVISKVRSHEIDLFKLGPGGHFPGIAEETEWNNKDPFFDRDLSNFYALHRAGAIAAGIIITRGPRLLRLLMADPRLTLEVQKKYGVSTTHWGKLMPRVDVGGGGECPLLLVGIEPERLVEQLHVP
jgi:hypothetical protein